MRVVDRIRIPALILTADDDPFVPSSQFGEPAVRNNPNIVVRVERNGGHCGFVGEAVNGSDGYWAEDTAVEFIAAALQARSQKPETTSAINSR
jgi:predicted alpha/beta-fold hydrolase